MSTENHQAAAVAAFSGLATLILDGIAWSKLFAAFAVAIATGAGYRLGTLFISWFVGIIKSKR